MIGRWLLLTLIILAGVPSALAELPRIDVESDRLARLPGLEVTEIILREGTLLEADELGLIFSLYLNRFVTIEELHGLRLELSRLYFERGRVNSGVIMPDQRVSNGVVIFEEVTGHLAGIEIIGVRHLPQSWVEKSLFKGMEGAPLDVFRLQSSMQLLQQHHMIDRINAQIVPGPVRGQDKLLVDVTESSLHRLSVTSDNYRSPAVGGEEIVLSYWHGSLAGVGDTLDLNLSHTDGINGGNITYNRPLGWGPSLEFSYSVSDSSVVEAPFDELDIKSRAESYSVAAIIPMIRSLTRNISLVTTFERKRSASTLLGSPYSFTPGDLNGETESNLFNLEVDFTNSGADDVLAVRVGVRTGLNQGAKSSFRSLKSYSVRGQAHYTRILPNLDSRLTVRSMFQRASEPLLAVEKLPIGGIRTVRGYRENLLVRDNGMSLSLDWSVPLAPNLGRPLDLTLFADWGSSWDQDVALATNDAEDISAMGFSVDYRPTANLLLEFTYAYALDKRPRENEDIQDKGLHFSVTYTVN
jgi:hemolysin activation/secretion protein